MTHTFDPDALLTQAGWLRGLARGLVLDEAQADDVVQQTWLRALEHPPREPKALPAWLAAVARNEARQSGRSEGARTRRQRRVARPEASVQPTSDVVARAELHKELVRRVLDLPEPQKSTLLLRYFEGLEPSEIARRQDVPAGTVRSRLKRGLDTLRTDLDRECGGDRRAWVAALLPWTGMPRAAPATGGGGALGAVVMGVKGTTIAALLAVLLVGGLLGWSLWRGSDDDEGTREIYRGGGGQPVLRGRADGDEAPGVVVREEGSEAEEPPAPVAPAGARVTLAFVDEEGRAWTPEELQERYGAVGLPPRLTFVRDAQLTESGLEGLIATLFGPAEAWQEAVELAWTGEGTTAHATEAGLWRVFVPRPGAAPYLSPPQKLAEGEATRLEVPLPRTPRHVTVRLLDAVTGRPLGGTKVTPFHEVGDDQAFLRGPSVTADAAGDVTLPVYDAKLSGRSRGATWWAETKTHARSLSNFHLARQDEGVVLEWTVYPTATATGRVWLSSGEPAVGREVIWARKGRVRRTIVQEDGTYTLTGIAMSDRPARTEKLMLLEDPARGLVSGGRVELRAGETTEADLGEPASPSAAALVGWIRAGDRPLPGVFVGVKAPGGKRLIGRTDEEGVFRFSGLKEGAAQVEVYFGDPRVVDDFAARSTEPVQLAAGTETRLDFALPEGAILLTLVRDDDGEPVVGGVGMARPADPTLEAKRFPGFSYRPGWGGRTGEDGTILLLGLVPGHVHEIEAGGEGYEKATREDVLPGTVTEPALVTVRLKASGGGGR